MKPKLKTITFNSCKRPGIVIIYNTQRLDELALIVPIKKQIVSTDPAHNTHILMLSNPEGLKENDNFIGVTYHPSYQAAKEAYLATVASSL